MSGKRAEELAASLAASMNAATGITKTAGAGYGVQTADLMPVAKSLLRTERRVTKGLKRQRHMERLIRAMTPDPPRPSVATIQGNAEFQAMSRLHELPVNGYDRHLPTTNGRADAPQGHEG